MDAIADGALVRHSAEYRRRRFLNWFPLGLTYAFLYMGRYNLTIAKTSLGELMTKEDFGVIFGAGTLVYAFSFLVNAPLVDRIGGRKGMLIGAFGAMLANFAMGGYLSYVISSGVAGQAPLRLVFSVLYAANMYFQSYGAVSIVKVNANWFHVTERGGFSGVFGTMIASGIFLAFTGNSLILRIAQMMRPSAPALGLTWVVFAIPGVLLGLFFLIELFLLRDRPGQAGQKDFDTGDASSGDTSDAPIPTLQLFKRILTHPVIITIALIEFCTGVLRNGVMHWFPIYATEIWALPLEHPLQGGVILAAIRDWSWKPLWPALIAFAVAAISGWLASKSQGARRGYYVIGAALAFLAPFVAGGWGGVLMVAGVIGGNVAGWVSDLFFQSRRGPAAAGLYALLAVCTVGMAFTLSTPTSIIESADPKSGLQPGDRLLAVGNDEDVQGWSEVRDAVACWPPQCKDSGWDKQKCMCSTALPKDANAMPATTIPTKLERGGTTTSVAIVDPKPVQRAGDMRLLKAKPKLPLSPFWLGAMVFLVSLGVIGTHGVLSGTATMDFGGRKAAATAVGVIDGFVYLGTGFQSLCLGYLTSKNWSYWPWFLLPFAVIGLYLCTRIWSARPSARSGH